MSLIIAGGCHSSGPPLEGHWQGRLTLPANPPAPEDLLNTAERVNLILHPNGRYDLVWMGLPLEGDFSRSGGTLTLTPKVILNRPINQTGPGMEMFKAVLTAKIEPEKLVIENMNGQAVELRRIGGSK